MKNTIVKIEIIRSKSGTVQKIEDNVISEYSLTLTLNGKRFVRLLCSPVMLKELAVGYLYSEGVIKSFDDIRKISIDYDKGIADIELVNNDTLTLLCDHTQAVRTVTTACGKQHSVSFPIYNDLSMVTMDDDIYFNPEEVLNAVNTFNHDSELFKLTGGVHSCALCQDGEVIVKMEDIGRHNAFDKVLGYGLANSIPFKGRYLLTSGRVPSDMIVKVVNAGIPMVVSRSAPTDIAVEMAKRCNLTLVGFARGKRMNVYSGAHRLF